jgi:hypothetical protein
MSSDKAAVKILYTKLREAFPDFSADIKWQSADGDLVTTYKIYHGTHSGEFLGIPATGRIMRFETAPPCAWSTGRSSSTGGWAISTPSSINSAPG